MKLSANEFVIGPHRVMDIVNYDPIKLKIDTTKAGSAADTFILAVNPSYSYDYGISWGDDSEIEYVDTATNRTHVYAVPGIYTISLFGTFAGFYFNNTGDCQKVLEWWPATNTYRTMQNAFYGCTNLTTIHPNAADVSTVTDFSNCFAYCTLLASTDFSNFDTSNVTTMQGMFYNCTAFNQSVSNFDTSSVTTMLQMFFGCTMFNQSVSNFDTSKVTNMQNMFQSCIAFNQSVSNFDTSNVTNMASMFYNCSAFKQDLSSFNITSLLAATNMLSGCDINDTGTTTRYNALLNSWAAQAFKPNVPFHAGSPKYSHSAMPARAALVSAGWVISDGGPLFISTTEYLDTIEMIDTQPLEAGVRTAVDAFVSGCISDGIWDSIQACCILSGAHTLAGALLPLKGPMPSNYNFISADYDRQIGLKGNASTKYLRSNWNNNADPQNSQHLSVYASEALADNSRYMGSGDINGSSTIGTYNANMGFRSRVSANFDVGAALANGFMGISRSSSTAVTSRVGSVTRSHVSTSQTPANASIEVFRGGAFPTASRIAFYSIGSNLNLALLDARVSALMAAIDAAVLA